MGVCFMAQGADVENQNFPGEVRIITHIGHKGVLRAISAAHVLTQHDPNQVGSCVGKPVTGVSRQLDVTLYDIDEQLSPHLVAPSLYDFAWCDLDTPEKLQCVGDLSIPSFGDINVNCRLPVADERVALYAIATDCHYGFVRELSVESAFGMPKTGKKVLQAGGFVVELDYPAFAAPGISGTLVLAENGHNILGILKGSHTEPGLVYICRFPEPHIWGNKITVNS